MDPLSVLRTLMQHKWIAFPVLAFTAAACVYVVFFGPRSYAATASYVLITPGMPTETEVRENPRLTAEADNPYLRSDPALVGQVVAGRLRSGANVETLKAGGFSTDFTVGPGVAGSQQIVTIDVLAGSTPAALDTAAELGRMLAAELKAVQTVNGAADRFLISAQPISLPDTATERLSSRLRLLIIVGLGGLVVLFGAVSLARALDKQKESQRVDRARAAQRQIGETFPHGHNVPHPPSFGHNPPMGPIAGPRAQRGRPTPSAREQRPPYSTERRGTNGTAPAEPEVQPAD